MIVELITREPGLTSIEIADRLEKRASRDLITTTGLVNWCVRRSFTGMR